jgi:YfiH family protein
VTNPKWTVEHSDLGRIVIPPFLPEGFALFCTTRDYFGAIAPDRVARVLAERFGLEATLASCVQIHSANVRRVQREREWRECDGCDALFTDDRGVALAIKIADCLPVTLIDPEHDVIANVHSGWRGAAQKIVAATLDSVARETMFEPRSAFAYLGPSIRVCCFEVGEEVAAQFDSRFVRRDREKPHVDLPAFTRDVLLSRGIPPDRVFDSELCTRCEGSIFHSYRRDKEARGRNLTIVAQ